ncbi:MAG: hypothetical protein ACHREM_05685 [Polyangiales bacterium]
MTGLVPILVGLLVGFASCALVWLAAGERLRGSSFGGQLGPTTRGQHAPLPGAPFTRPVARAPRRTFRRADRPAAAAGARVFKATPKIVNDQFSGAATQAPNAPCRFCGKPLAEGEHTH